MFKHKQFDPLWVGSYFALIVAVAIGAYYFFFMPEAEIPVTIVVERGDLINEVTFTGTVVPTDRVDLGFEKGGRVAFVLADVGDTVFRGALIASLDTTESRARLSQARADLEVAEATLRKLEVGTRPEEILVERTKVDNARTALEDSRLSLVNTIKNSFTALDDAVRDDIDQFFSNQNSNNPSITFITNVQSKVDVETSRFEMQDVLKNWQTRIVENSWDISILVEAATADLEKGEKLLNRASNALHNAVPSQTVSSAQIQIWIGEVGVARGVLDAALSTIVVAEGAYNTAKANLSLVNEQLLLLEAGTLIQDVDAQRAAVRSKEANVELLEAELDNSLMYAPITGIVTQREIEQGEIAQINASVITIISDTAFEIDANVSELDIASLAVGNQAFVTLDTYGDDEIFDAVLKKINPAERSLGGVPAYGVTLQFIEDDNRIRPGMTANVTVIAGVRENVLFIPNYALKREGTKKVARVFRDDEIQIVEVSTGLQSTKGDVEIVDGLVLGDVLLIDERK
jgi:HlyD family secretion protein